MKKLANNWQKHLIAITWSFVFVIWLFWLNSGFFTANITAPDFQTTTGSIASWYDIAIGTSFWVSGQNWALNISTWDAQVWILSTSFKLKYSPNEVLIKQIIDPVTITPDFLDINVDNQEWIAEINIINSDDFDLWEAMDFVKLEMVLDKNLVQWDSVKIAITDVEMIDRDFKISQWSWKAWYIDIISSEEVWPNLLVMNSFFETLNWEASILFNDYVATIWNITFLACNQWSNPTLTWSILKEWKNAKFQVNWIWTWEICRIELSWFEWNIKNDLKENFWYIAWYNATWSSLIAISNIFKNSFEVEFTWWNKADIENPTNYKLLKWDAQVPTSWEVIRSISYNEISKIAKFEISKIFDTNQRYILIADSLGWVSSNSILTFVTENTWVVELVSINPNICNWTWCLATVQWDNLNNVDKFLIWNNEATIISRDNFSTEIQIPAIKEWKYDLIAIDKNDKRIVLENIFTFIEKEVQKITVNSTWSYASPSRILNNSLMETTLWTVISWINWVNDINRVTVDLRPIWWSPVAQMERITVADQKIWFSLENVIAHPTAQTSDDAIKLKITAEDTNWVKDYWTISLYVTNNLIVSAAPELTEPSIVYEKWDSQINAFIKVTDDDWVHDIQTVTVDLSSFWLWYHLLSPIDELWEVISRTWEVETDTELLLRNEKKTSIFKLENPLTIPNDKKVWKYDIIFSAYDKTWEEAILTYDFDYIWWNPPEFTRIYDKNEDDENDNQYVHLNRWKVPNDWYTSFNLSTTVRDEDWANDIVEVRADLTSIWWDVVILERQWVSSSGSAVKSAIFTLTWITIPSTVMLWWHEFVMVAHDKQWNQAIARVELKVTETDEQWEHVEVISEKGYTQPPFAQPWTGSVSLNVYVKNNWKKIETVIVYLENIAKYIWEWNWSTWTWDDISNKYCQNQSERIVCMKPSVMEWREWQWFRLDDVQALLETRPSTERYRIKVMAIEEWGEAIEWWTYMTVNDWTLPTYDNGSPKMQMAISTSDNSVQLVFSNPLDLDKLKASYFKITNAEDISEHIAVKSLTTSSDQKIVILKTWDQIKSMRYTVVANSEKIWLKEDSFTDNHKDFIWFDKDAIAPQLYKIETLTSTKLALYFDQWITPSTIEKHSDNFEIFTSDLETKQLKVKLVEFADNNNKVIYLSTEKQKMNQDYTLLIQNVTSAAWVPIWWYQRAQSRYANWRYYWMIKEFVWHIDDTLHASAVKNWTSNFNLSNPDGSECIDFMDFTMFSRDYSNWVPSSEYFDYNFDNKINFIDFTIFSTEYWKCNTEIIEEEPEENPESENDEWDWENDTGTWDSIELPSIKDLWGNLIAPYN